MNVRHWGDGDRTALLLHCSLARASAWTSVAHRLVGQGWRVTAPNLPGHGQGPDAEPARDYLDQALDVAVAALDGPAHVVGHSYGGVVALRLAVERPDLVRALTLYEPVFFAAARGTPAHARHEAAFAPFGVQVAAEDWDAASRTFLDVWGEGPAYDDLPVAERSYIRDRIRLVVSGSPGMNDDNAGILPRLSDIACPVTIVLGERAFPVTRATAVCLSERIAQARMDQMAGAGHLGPLTQPDTFAALIG